MCPWANTSTSRSADLAQATQTAALMVGALGMGGSLISFEAVSEAFVSHRNLVGKVLADTETKRRVESLLREQKDRIREVLDSNRDLVEALRDALLERDELVGEQILEVIRAALAKRAREEQQASTPAIDLTVTENGDAAGDHRTPQVVLPTAPPPDRPRP